MPNGLSWRSLGNCVHEPCALKEALNPLLAYKLIRFLVEFIPQIPISQMECHQIVIRKAKVGPYAAPTLSKASEIAYRIGILLKRSSSNSNSSICRSLTFLYSHSKKSYSTSCHVRTFSLRSATLILVSWFDRRAHQLNK